MAEDRPTDEQILAYEQAIKESEALSAPLVGELEPLSHLKAEYEQSVASFRSKFEAGRSA